MASTEPPARRGGGSTVRHYLIAALASAYVIAWWAFGRRTSAPVPPQPTLDAAPPASVLSPVATWYQDLPPSARPPIALPAGWHVAERTTAAPAVRAAPIPVRAPARRVRIRTRSS